jgi:cation transport ATPase
MATAPAIVQFIGGTPADALQYTLEMYDITVTEDSQYQLPQLNFRGTPTGIDIRQVVRQNLFWAFFYNTVGVTLAAAGLINPILAAGAMVVSSLSVIWNSKRIH